MTGGSKCQYVSNRQNVESWCSLFSQVNQHVLYFQAASIKWGAFQAAMRAMEEAKNAQSAAIKHLEEKEQRGAENWA